MGNSNPHREHGMLKKLSERPRISVEVHQHKHTGNGRVVMGNGNERVLAEESDATTRGGGGLSESHHDNGDAEVSIRVCKMTGSRVKSPPVSHGMWRAARSSTPRAMSILV